MAKYVGYPGAVESYGAATSYVDIAGAYMDLDAGSGFAQFGAKGPGSLGLKLRTVLAGVALTVLTITAAGVATFGYNVAMAGGTTLAAQAVTATTFTGSGLATFSAGATVSSGQTLTLTGATVAGAPTWSSTQSLNTSGSAATLTNTRTIFGQNFNGSANVSGAFSGATTGDFSGLVTLGNGLSITSGTAALQAVTATTLTVGTGFSATAAGAVSGITTLNLSSNLTQAGGTAALQAVTATTLSTSGVATFASVKMGTASVTPTSGCILIANGKPIQAQNTDNVNKLHLIGTAGGTNVVVIAGDGDSVRMPAYSAGTATFDASGNISSSSDERLKHIEGAFTVGMEGIRKLEPILYKWNALSGMEQQHTYAGFGAANAQSASKYATGVDQRGYLSLQDRALIAMLVNAVKELDKDLETLKLKLT